MGAGSPATPRAKYTWGDPGYQEPSTKHTWMRNAAALGAKPKTRRERTRPPGCPSGSPHGPLTVPSRSRAPPRPGARAHPPPPLSAFHVATASPPRMRAGRRGGRGETGAARGTPGNVVFGRELRGQGLEGCRPNKIKSGTEPLPTSNFCCPQ